MNKLQEYEFILRWMIHEKEGHEKNVAQKLALKEVFENEKKDSYSSGYLWNRKPKL